MARNWSHALLMGFNVYQDSLGKNILTSSLRESDSPEYAASFNPNALLEFTRWNLDRVLLICSPRTLIGKYGFGFRKETNPNLWRVHRPIGRGV